MHQAWNKEKEVCQIMQRSGVHESCSKRRSLHEAWSKGQTMQQCGMNNSNSSSKRRSGIRHGAKVKLCSKVGCTNGAKKGGVMHKVWDKEEETTMQ